MDTIKEELKQEIKLELSQIASQHSPSLQAHDIQVLAASVSSKGSCAAPKTSAIGKKASDMHGNFRQCCKSWPHSQAQRCTLGE